MSTTARTSVLRGLDPTPFHFGAVEDIQPSIVLPFAPLFDAEPTVLEDEFKPLFQANEPSLRDTPAVLPAASLPTYADGLEAGRADRDDEVAALEAEVERLTEVVAQAEDAESQHQTVVAGAVERLSALWSDAVRALEADLAALAIDAAEGVLGAPLTDAQRTAASSVLAQAVDVLAGGPAIGIAIHPVDYLHLCESGLADAMTSAHPGLNWDSDATLNEGDWRVATSEGAVHRVRADMLDSLRDRLGLRTDPS